MPSETHKPKACYIDIAGDVSNTRKPHPTDTPAVAITRTAYDDTRQTLRNAVAILAHVGRRDMMDQCRKMLDRLPEIPE